MGSKKAAHAYLKGVGNHQHACHVGRETLFGPDASVKLRADGWDRIWQRD